MKAMAATSRADWGIASQGGRGLKGKMDKLTFQPAKPIVIARCAVCEAPRTCSTEDTWFFVTTPKGPCHVCSRDCLVKFVQALPEDKPPLARLKHSGCHVLLPHRRE